MSCRVRILEFESSPYSLSIQSYISWLRATSWLAIWFFCHYGASMGWICHICPVGGLPEMVQDSQGTTHRCSERLVYCCVTMAQPPLLSPWPTQVMALLPQMPMGKKVWVCMIDGVMVGCPCCAVHNCKVPLEKN